MPPASQLVLMAEANPDGNRENKEISDFNSLKVGILRALDP